MAIENYVLAVSGGVDSVVLLDMASKWQNCEIVVAHFDHGIRDDSAEDQVFVRNLAKKYNFKYESKREELGKNTSEETARNQRYDFLRAVAKKYKAKLVTAHHADDAVETIVINLIRGTGWRGLAVLDSADILRPLTNMTKKEIIAYANDHDLKWREDSTNLENNYLRNRVRRKTSNIDEKTRRQILELWQKQKNIKNKIDIEVKKIIDNNFQDQFSRYFFINIDQASAIECLRHITKARLTRPQLNRLLHEIKAILPGKTFQAGNGVIISFSARNFTVELIK